MARKMKALGLSAELIMQKPDFRPRIQQDYNFMCYLMASNNWSQILFMPLIEGCPFCLSMSCSSMS